MALTHEEVTQILQIVEASRAGEVVLELGDTRLTILRQDAAPAGTARPAPSAAAHRTAGETGRDPVRVTAPTVGTVQLRAAPDEPPFVEVGAKVGKGRQLCQIDVMGDCVTVEAPAAGTIRIVAAAEGAFVEFGQVLFVVEPDHTGGENGNE